MFQNGGVRRHSKAGCAAPLWHIAHVRMSHASCLFSWRSSVFCVSLYVQDFLSSELCLLATVAWCEAPHTLFWFFCKNCRLPRFFVMQCCHGWCRSAYRLSHWYPWFLNACMFSLHNVAQRRRYLCTAAGCANKK